MLHFYNFGNSSTHTVLNHSTYIFLLNFSFMLHTTCWHECILCILLFHINVDPQRKPPHSSLPKLNLQPWQRQCVFVCHPHSLPTAWGQDDKRQAWMGLWARDCRNPACFYVVSFQSEAGHCYRFNNRNDYKSQTACIHVPGRMGRPFPNGPNPSSWEMRGQDCDNYLPGIVFPFKRRCATVATSSSRWNVHSADEKKTLWLKWFR